jgi:hypothetical protein
MISCEALRLQDSVIIQQWQVKFTSQVQHTDTLSQENKALSQKNQALGTCIRFWRTFSFILGAALIGSIF